LLTLCSDLEASKWSDFPSLTFWQGAAVAYVADMFSTPAIFVKAVTDIVDGVKPTYEEFLQNLIAVTTALELAVTKVVDFISGKRISDL
jgi:5'-methylthioadenosine nucleosidase